jgi:hypothetical protein
MFGVKALGTEQNSSKIILQRRPFSLLTAAQLLSVGCLSAQPLTCDTRNGSALSPFLPNIGG